LVQKKRNFRLLFARGILSAFIRVHLGFKAENLGIRSHGSLQPHTSILPVPNQRG